MKLLFLIVSIIALVGLLCSFARGFSAKTALTSFFHAPLGFVNGIRFQTGLSLANIGEGTHEGGRATRKADAAIATRFLLMKIGSDADHVAAAGTADIAIGVCTDEAAAAEDLVNIQLLGACDTTVKMVASAAIAAGDMVSGAASGKIRTLPATTGTYYILGRALNAAAADGDVVEVDPSFPIQRVVP